MPRARQTRNARQRSSRDLLSPSPSIRNVVPQIRLRPRQIIDTEVSPSPNDSAQIIQRSYSFSNHNEPPRIPYYFRFWKSSNVKMKLVERDESSLRQTLQKHISDYESNLLWYRLTKSSLTTVLKLLQFDEFGHRISPKFEVRYYSKINILRGPKSVLKKAGPGVCSIPGSEPQTPSAWPWTTPPSILPPLSVAQAEALRREEIRHYQQMREEIERQRLVQNMIMSLNPDERG